MADSFATATTTTTSVFLSQRVLFHHKFTGHDSRRRQLVFLRGNPVIPTRNVQTRKNLKVTRALSTTETYKTPTVDDPKRIPRDWNYRVDPLVWPSHPNKADDSTLHNPLLRQQRLGSGWLGVILEWEGVVIEDDSKLEQQAWLILSDEQGKPTPPTFLLNRIQGMKSEQAISEILCWSRDPSTLRRLADCKEEIHRNLQGGFYRFRHGSKDFITSLSKHDIPIAIASTRPRRVIEEAVKFIGADGYFDVIVAAEDVHRGKPDPEMFMFAAQHLGIIPDRCIVFGNSNSTVEAAHDCRMKCVAVASKHPVYELGAANRVVRRLSELCVVDLKNLAAIESPELLPEVEMEEEDDDPVKSIKTDDYFW
ncbi:HAD-superfamily hydrolase subfamily IA, variant 3:Beta-phosphoglucomutasehydrolase [Zostera marina]|uniref:HAD-superfamily hydrolase subfamily IA, variant 3:Beta-phosphoglucomutasehydrolase n=1 Tax=Zostera marina TaxID=29655 RepID=A0A0K9PDY2_ZOSMR|nr:HAD-superfamily hydrolase subfamily IA, variant 3:Beta-phosphoglucomutasehydrolase [Zostera marina]